MSKTIKIILYISAIMGAFLFGYFAMSQENLGATSNTREWVYSDSSKLIRSLSVAQGTLISNNGSTATTSSVALEVIGSTLMDNATTTNFAITGLTSGNCVQAGTGGHFLSASAACGSGSGGGSPWEQLFANTLSPTNTSAGIFVNASSTFNSTLRVNATSTLDGNLFSENVASSVIASGQAITADIAGHLRVGGSFPSIYGQDTTDGLTLYAANDAGSEALVQITGVNLYLGHGTGGNVIIQGVSQSALLDVSVLTDTRTFTFPDATGTFCLTVTCAPTGFQGAWQKVSGVNALSPTNTALGILINAASSTITTLFTNNATSTATTTAQGLKVGNLVSCDTVNTTAEGHFICGSDADSGGGGGNGSWQIVATNVLAPTNTAAGILVNSASSSISTLRVSNSLNASTTMIGTLNLSGGSITNYFGTACTGNDFLQDIADNGAFTCTTATGSGAPGQNGAWQIVATNTLSPTNTAAGILVNSASSSISTLRISNALNATTSLIDTLTLTNDLTVVNGGTGASTLTDGGVLVGSGTGAITALTAGTNGQLLIGSTGADPVFATLNCADNLTCTTGAGTLEIDVDNSFILNTGDTGTGLYVLPDLRAAVLNSTSSLIDTLFVGNSTTTATSTTQGLKVGNLINCDTVNTTAEGHFVCGSDESGGGGSPGAWEKINGVAALAPTSTTNGILVNAASSTITTLVVNTLNLSGSSITNYFGTACTGNSWLQDIGDTGAFTCTALTPPNGAWQAVATNVLQPTNTSAGIYVLASSTFNSTLRVNGNTSLANASTTGYLVVGGNPLLNLGDGDVWIGDDLFIATLWVINFNNGDLTITHSANALAFACVTGNYSFDDTIQPVANDGAALGVSGTAFSDIFLATGAIIDFNAGAETITHAANALTFAGFSTGLTFSDGILTMTGTALFTNASSTILNDFNIGDDATTTDLFTIGTTANAFRFNPTVGLEFAGTAKPYKSFILTAGGARPTISDAGTATTSQSDVLLVTNRNQVTTLY